MICVRRRGKKICEDLEFQSGTCCPVSGISVISARRNDVPVIAAVFRRCLALVCLDRHSVTPDLMFSGNESYTPANIQSSKFKSVDGGLIASLCEIRARSCFLQCGWRGKDFGYFYFASVCEDLLSQAVLLKRPQATRKEGMCLLRDGRSVCFSTEKQIRGFNVWSQ